ncbi:TonB-dependent receptor, partial [Steroidobacter sp.]|uniref:TonB-dependent receptor n=1 Tax=Steroidobacter sp. TaxID=1978227 RepID=UPI001A38B95F
AFEPSLLLSHRYISEAPSGVLGQPLQQGDFHLLDARLAVRFDKLDVTLFVNNISNEHGVTTQMELGDQVARYLTRPRTVGLTLAYRL